VFPSCFAHSRRSLRLEHGHGHDHANHLKDLTTSTSQAPDSCKVSITQTSVRPSRPSADSRSSAYGRPAALRALSLQDVELRSVESSSPSPRSQDTHNQCVDAVHQDDGAGINELHCREAAMEGESAVIPGQSLALSPGDQSTRMGPRGMGSDHGHEHGSMNMRAIALHVLGDAFGNIGVIATGLIIWLTTWSFRFYCDPIISLVIAVIIFSTALPLSEPRLLRTVSSR
jgi:solute carrier family 30 (zinc transporter), member 1